MPSPGTAGQELRLTREELYERVWAESMAVLAPRFGISDVGLKKTCKRLRVPTPGRGYWAKKSAGIAVKRTPLPKLPASVPTAMQSVTFGRPPKPPKEGVADATGPVADQSRYEAMPEHGIVVGDVLTEPHPLVAASVHLLRRAKGDAQHRLLPRGSRCLALSVTMGTVDRALRIYDALIKALEERGHTVEVSNDERTTSTMVHVGDERVGVAIEERVDRVEEKGHPKSPRPPFFGPQYDYIPTGRLTFRITADYLGIRRTW